MFIQFKNVSTTTVAIALVAIAARGDGSDDAEMHQSYNPNQRAALVGTTLTIEGERCALWGDDLAPLMAHLRAIGEQPTAYKTADARLYWHETLASYLETRASPAEVLDAVKAFGQNRTSVYCAASALAEKAERCQPGTMAYRRALADGTVPPKEAYVILEIFERQHDYAKKWA